MLEVEDCGIDGTIIRAVAGKDGECYNDASTSDVNFRDSCLGNVEKVCKESSEV